jgi:hypothetical protein
MNDGDGMMTMVLQARQIADNATMYNGSAPCPTCGVIMNPVEFISNRGHCLSCVTQRNAKRIKEKMA